MNKLQKKFLKDKMEATEELIFQAELGIKFFESQTGIELQGQNIADQEIKKYKEILRIKEAEKLFLESLI